MRKPTSKNLKKELIKIINKNKIDYINEIPRYYEDFGLKKMRVGTVLTIGLLNR
jgi:hypothetical protein